MYEIIMKDDSGIGYGYVYEVEGLYNGIVYQNRLSSELLDKNATTEELIDEIDYGNSFCIDSKGLKGAINEVLEFYFMKGINEVPSVVKEGSIQAAIKHLKEHNLNYYIFTMDY